MAASRRSKFPSSASLYRRSHLDSLHISYDRATDRADDETDPPQAQHLYQWFFKRIGQIKPESYEVEPSNTIWWQELDLYVSNKQTGFATGKLVGFDKTSCSRLQDIFRSRAKGRASDESDNSFLKGLLNTLSDARSSAVASRGVSFNRDKYESLGKVIRFMENLDMMIRKMVVDSSEAPNKAAFVNLFERFAYLCELDISPGYVKTRKMNVLGTQVTSSPDVQFGKIYEENGFLVITVDEFKPGQKDEFEDSESEGCKPPLRTRKRKVTDEEQDEVEERSKKSKVNDEGEESIKGYGSKLQGQHGAELLLELPFTALREFGHQDRVFGFVVQATMVRLTCLRMTKEHLKRIQRNEDLEVTDNAIIYYTKSYDYLNRPEREELECVLLTLSYLARI
ncbi:uncharacterized protein LOC135488093 [Lineus longissimus]|uniref:uncharacterized protein LOC135488093 n=1 Tax=Lineus longissimus TaxID=88925 RepID=UPI00315D98CD